MLFSPFVYRVKFQPLPVGDDNDTGGASSIPGRHDADGGRPGHKFRGDGKCFTGGG